MQGDLNPMGTFFKAQLVLTFLLFSRSLVATFLYLPTYNELFSRTVYLRGGPGRLDQKILIQGPKT